MYLRVDLQMQLTHPRDDGFFALRVKVHSKSRIFTGEPVDAFREFIHVVLRGQKETEGHIN